VVRRFEYADDPKSYASGSVATGRASHAGKVEGRHQTKRDPPPPLPCGEEGSPKAKGDNPDRKQPAWRL